MPLQPSPMQKIFRLLLAASAVLLAVLWFAHWSTIRTLNSGEVHLRPQPANPASPGIPPPPASSSTGAATLPPQQIAANPPAAPAAQSQNGIGALPAFQPSPRSSGGLVTVGSPRFQLYRQGDITFRLNTETGQACVLFATIAQWRKPLVYGHGCATH